MNLREAFDQGLVKVGDKCLSVINTIGYVTKFSPKDMGKNSGWLTINWENGNSASAAVDLNGCGWFDKITYVGAA